MGKDDFKYFSKEFDRTALKLSKNDFILMSI